MGQYYKFINVDKKETCERNKYTLKLMEHSYLYNAYCSDILSLLSDEWRGNRVMHVGDYAEPNDETTTQEIIKSIYSELKISTDSSLYNKSSDFKDIEPRCDHNIRYVYNLDKKEYVDLYSQPIQYVHCYENVIESIKINSFALLVACGNGLGGGDYFGINKEYVGYWAGDRFVSSEEPLKKYEKYRKLDLVFNERKEYEQISFLKKDEIIKIEEQIIKKDLDFCEKYLEQKDNIKIDAKGLYDEEYELIKKNTSIFKSKNKNITEYER